MAQDLSIKEFEYEVIGYVRYPGLKVGCKYVPERVSKEIATQLSHCKNEQSAGLMTINSRLNGKLEMQRLTLPICEEHMNLLETRFPEKKKRPAKLETSQKVIKI